MRQQNQIQIIAENFQVQRNGEAVPRHRAKLLHHVGYGNHMGWHGKARSVFQTRRPKQREAGGLLNLDVEKLAC